MAYLEFDSISKRFPGVYALDHVSFGVEHGSVRGVVGENGAGKSTLLKILSGVYSPTTGCVRIAGQEQRFLTAADAIAAGVAVIYQELHLVPEMTVAENVYLGHLPTRAGIVNRRELHAQTRARLRELGEDIAPAEKVGQLPIAQRQMIEIAKALTRGANIIAFDEPTSSLSAREIDRLLAIIATLKQAGKVVVYISHRMEEIVRICDSVTVLRDGRHVDTIYSMRDATHDRLVKSMVGRDINDVYGYAPRTHRGVVLTVTELNGPGLSKPVSFNVAHGEILGIFGLVGAGRTELFKLLYGAVARTSGTVTISGEPINIRCPRDAIRAGLVLCPEDRKAEGIIPIRSVADNINLSARRHHSRLGGVLNQRWERHNARSHIDRLAIRTPSPNQMIRYLSGGNQQKAILARWLSEQVRVVLFDEPTRGIDVGAKREIYDLMYGLARRGIGIVMISSDLPEVLGVADRVMVMREGTIAGVLDRDDADREHILQLALPAAGVHASSIVK